MSAPERPASDAAPSSSRAGRILDEGPIAALVTQRRWDDALAKLNAARDAAPRDADIAEAIRTLRDRALGDGLERLGSTEAIPVRTGKAAALGADERYLLGLITDDAAVDEILAASTLGRHRTVRGLCGLLDLAAIRVEPLLFTPSAPETTSAMRHVVVADGHPSSAALTRTMLRLALGGSAHLETVTTTAQLAVCGARQKPDLLVTELVLVGGDALAALRTLRRTVGQVVPVILIASRVDRELAVARAPERSVVLGRPIEKAALVDALESLGFARKT